MSGQQQPQGGGGGSEGSLDFFWGIVIVIAALLAIWYFGQSYISAAVLQIRYYEIIAITFVLDGVSKGLVIFNLPTPNTYDLHELASYIQSKPSSVSFSRLAEVSTQVGDYIRYPGAIILGLLAMVTYFTHVTAKFKSTMSMNSLRKLEEENWPQITPISKVNLVKQDIDEGPWAMAQTPMQFCKKNDLLLEEVKDGKPVATLKRGAASRVFALQIGPAWNGQLQSLPIHVRALLAVFAARANRDTQAATDLLLQIAKSAANGKLNFAGVDQLLAKNINFKPTEKTLSMHAYVVTMMASMLTLGRTDGVLATSDFLWLKPLDRRLWYMLNSVGRQTAVSEVAGPFAHWLAEKEMKYPLKVPMVDEAVNGLQAALDNILYEPEDA